MPGGVTEDLDPRWAWVAVRRLCGVEPTWVRGRCLHTEVVPVESTVDGAVLAMLCLTCDTQLSKWWKP